MLYPISKCFFVLFTLTSFLIFSNSSLCGKEENPLPTLCIGGGYLDGGSNHSGGAIHVQYKSAKYLWYRLRPQVTFIMPEFSSFFLGLGIGLECKLTERITLTPSFSRDFIIREKVEI